MDNKELDNCIESFKKTGDNLYYEKIYKFFFPKIFRFVLLNISDIQAAEDLSVDVFYNIYRYITKININSVSFKPWIYKIARNLVIDYYRKEGRSQKSLSLDQYIEESNSDSFGRTEKIDKSLVVDNFTEKSLSEFDGLQFSNQDLLKGLDGLPEIQKQVIILRFVEELDYRSIGIVINKNEIAVRAIKFRAISALKEVLIK